MNNSPLDGMATEQQHLASTNLGSADADTALRLMEAHEHEVLDALVAAHDQLAIAAQTVASIYMAGGRTVFIGAGTSGRLALQEVSELPPTFGVPAELFVAFLATRTPIGPAAVAPTEDDTVGIVEAIANAGIGDGDGVIGLAASGHTPFVLAGLAAARQAGAWTCGIANNSGTPLLEGVDLAVLLATGPELLTGSTRMKAGTAQKIAMNRITTTAMILAGRVRGSHMVELTGTNSKLRTRARRIVVELAGVSPERARELLQASDWHVGDTLRAFDSDGIGPLPKGKDF